MWSWTSNQGGEKRNQSQKGKTKNETTNVKKNTVQKEALFCVFTFYNPGLFVPAAENKQPIIF